MASKAYKFQAYPNAAQRGLIAKTFGCVRKVYNEQVSAFNTYDKTTNPKPHMPTMKEMKTSFPFLDEVSRTVLEYSVLAFNEARRRYFKGQNSRPKFKKKSNIQSLSVGTNGGRITLNGTRQEVTIDKIGRIRVRGGFNVKKLRDGYRKMTLSQTADGKYWISILVEEEIANLPKTNKEIGLDLGLKDLLVDQNANTWQNMRFLEQSQTHISNMQRALSGKKSGSKSYERLRIKIACKHRKLVNQRSDYLHKIAINLVRDNDLICMESLGIRDMLMVSSTDMARSISDVAWNSLVEKIRYKCDWYGKTFIQIDRYFASSKTCSECGIKHDNLKLKDRVWTCSCGYTHLRDKNAAKNILAEGKKLI
jgi:putative transposase